MHSSHAAPAGICRRAQPPLLKYRYEHRGPRRGRPGTRGAQHRRRTSEPSVESYGGSEVVCGDE